MKARLLVGLLATTLLASAPTEAHFKLVAPADSLQTDGTGDPMGTGGTQKTPPCGVGTASGAVTKVKSGSIVHIKVTETVPHGGHYRVALSQKADRSDLVEPVPVITSGQCASSPIEATPTLPVIADGLFVHTQAQAKAGTVYEADVTLPKITCTNCTLQIIEFMAPHAPSCYYHHCANLQIVADDDAGVGTPDGGTVVIDGGTTPTTDAGTSTTSDAGNTTIPGDDTVTSSDSGCSTSPGSNSGSMVILVGALMLVAGSRTRRRRD